MNIRYILLDICDTTINIQTADRFVEFVLRNTSPEKMVKLNFFKSITRNPFGYRLLKKLGIKYKLKILEYLKGLTYNTLNSWAEIYYEKELRNRYNVNVINFLKKFSHEAEIIIVSGGYDIYLKYIAKDLGVSHVVCSELKFQKGVFTGRINDIDCMGINKLVLLSKKGILKQLEFEKTVVLSDSILDLPLFSLGKYKIAVNPDKALKKLIGKGWYAIEEVV